MIKEYRSNYQKTLLSRLDEEELGRVGGDLVKLVQKRQDELAEGRFSAERITACVPPEYPEYERLMDIAQGVELVVREDSLQTINVSERTVETILSKSSSGCE
jgi:hypothetical protein